MVFVGSLSTREFVQNRGNRANTENDGYPFPVKVLQGMYQGRVVDDWGAMPLNHAVPKTKTEEYSTPD